MIKIAFFDIDGTLKDMTKPHMSDTIVNMLHQLQDKGIKICVATGRPPIILPDFRGVDFDVYLTFNASYCYTKEDVIFNNPIPNKDVQQIIKNATSIGRPVEVAGMDRMCANGEDQDLIDYMAISHQKVNIVEDFEEYSYHDIYQVMVGTKPSEHEALMKDASGAKLTAWWERAGDIVPANGGKGRGVQSVLDYYGFSKEEAVAFGDAGNDIEMLQAVGLGVAMENATAELKAVADDICGHVKDDGVYHYCVKKGWIE